MKQTNILSGTRDDLRLIREVRDLLKAASDRETVRRMAIFCSTLIEHQNSGGEIVLCQKGLPDRVAWMI